MGTISGSKQTGIRRHFRRTQPSPEFTGKQSTLIQPKLSFLIIIIRQDHPPFISSQLCLALLLQQQHARHQRRQCSLPLHPQQPPSLCVHHALGP